MLQDGIGAKDGGAGDENGKEDRVMRANVGAIDRLLRIIVGVVLLLMTPQIGALAGFPLGVSTMWGWIGVVPLLTGLFSFCPAYSLLGISSCKRN